MRQFLLFALLLGSVSVAEGQSGNLNTAINRYAAGLVKALSNNRTKTRFKVENKNTFHSDVDRDGDFDAVVEIFFCERSSCHPTTNSSRLAIFVKTKGAYTFVTDRRFVLYGKINSVDHEKINVDVYDLDEDDPQCCPQLKRFEKYVFKNRKLVLSSR